MSAHDTCSECGRILLYSNGALICAYRHCGAYGQDVSDDAAPAVECERRIGELVREGQRQGTVRVRGQREDLPRSGDLPSPTQVAGAGPNELTDSYAMADAPAEQFEQALSEARSEGNLSRANVVHQEQH